MPRTAQRLLPWLGAAAVVAIVTLAVVSVGEGVLSSVETGSVLIPLCAALGVAGLVAARAGRVTDENEREERARPARDQLLDLNISVADGPGSRTYLEGMEQWAIALLELVAHAIEVATTPDIQEELVAAREDTDALRSLLETAGGRELSLNEAATLHSVCVLWETSQDQIEELAAEVDPEWHRRWRARSVVERLLRHGPPEQPEVPLPYNT